MNRSPLAQAELRRFQMQTQLIRKHRPCSIEKCGIVPVTARGLCNRHYKLWSQSGKPLEFMGYEIPAAYIDFPKTVNQGPRKRWHDGLTEADCSDCGRRLRIDQLFSHKSYNAKGDPVEHRRKHCVSCQRKRIIVAKRKKAPAMWHGMNVVPMCNRCNKEQLPNGHFRYCPRCAEEVRREQALRTLSSPSIRRIWRKEAVALRENKCSKCGFQNEFIGVFDFHHRDPSVKSFSFCLIKDRDVYFEEISKCDMLCANCHRLEHYRIDQERRAGRASTPISID
jgi:hypothetical protein